MKSTAKTLLFCVLCLFGIGVNAQNSGSCGENATWNYENGTLTISGTGVMTDYDQYNNSPWSSLAANLQEVVIEEGITTVGNYAFYQCTSLQTTRIPASVTSIGAYAFRGTQLNSISIPASVTSIGASAFSTCTSLTSVTFAAEINLTSIGNYAFYQCSSLTAITLPNSLTSISDNLFDACTKLASVSLPENLKSIGYQSFNKCGLTSVTIPASVTSIGEQAFFGCSSLESVIFETGINLESIGNTAFQNCSSLTSISLPGSLTNISYGLFNNCTKLASVTLPTNLESIGDYSFSQCSLTSVTIPASVTNIGEYSFFQNGLTSVTIPASVSSIGEEAFGFCSNLQSVSFADGSNLASIGDWVFCSCSSLTSVTLPGSLTSISDYLFCGCSSLTSITLPASLGSIGQQSFYNSGLTSVTIPASVTTIGSNAFSSCSHLTDVYVSWGTPINLDSGIFDSSNNANLKLHVPYGMTHDYNNWYPNTEDDFIANFVEPNLVYVDNGGQQYESEFTGGPLTINDNFQTFISTNEVTGVDITYTRTFSRSDVWQAWYMPFDADYTEMSVKYDVAQILGVFMDAGGNTYITFQPMTSGTVKANTPYVVKPKTAGEVTLTLTGTTLKQTQGTPFTIQSSTQNFTFGGVYEKTVNGSNGWYAINTGGSFQALDTDVYLKPMRIWMTITDRSDNPYLVPAPAPQQVGIRVLGDNIVTGIGFIESDEQGGEFFNLQGQQVEEGGNGIVIVNGKKYLR